MTHEQKLSLLLMFLLLLILIAARYQVYISEQGSVSTPTPSATEPVPIMRASRVGRLQMVRGCYACRVYTALKPPLTRNTA
jgi:hypothetical protein